MLYGNSLNLNPFFIISNNASIKRVGDDINSNYCDYNGYYGLDSSGTCFENNIDLVNFSNPVEYIVTAKDGTTQKFTVEVEILLDSSKSILFFEVVSPLRVGVINESNKTISVKVPFETNIASLAPNIVISKNATINPSLGMARDFSTPVNYTLTAMDGTTKQYIVSIIKENLSYNLISTCQELQYINNNLNANYKLANNIDCNSFIFTPIGGPLYESGNCGSIFSGSFDGDGKTISNLTISRGDMGVGLFGCSSGNISNVGLVNVNISSFYYVGGLVGYQTGGSIVNSFSTGRVAANIGYGGFAGGLVGYQTGDSYISNCYSTADVSANWWHVAGLVGGGSRPINNSYTTGRITGSMSFMQGGLSPSYYLSEPSTSYWDVNTSGQFGSGTGIGKTTAEMKTPSTFVGWNTDIWDIVEGDYPILSWQKSQLGLDIVYPADTWDNANALCISKGGRLPNLNEACIEYPLNVLYWSQLVQGDYAYSSGTDGGGGTCIVSLSPKTESNPFVCVE